MVTRTGFEELGHQLLGDAAEIRRLAGRRQKNDRGDADLLLACFGESSATQLYSSGRLPPSQPVDPE